MKHIVAIPGGESVAFFDHSRDALIIADVATGVHRALRLTDLRQRGRVAWDYSRIAASSDEVLLLSSPTSFEIVSVPIDSERGSAARLEWPLAPFCGSDVCWGLNCFWIATVVTKWDRRGVGITKLENNPLKFVFGGVETPIGFPTAMFKDPCIVPASDGLIVAGLGFTSYFWVSSEDVAKDDLRLTEVKSEFLELRGAPFPMWDPVNSGAINVLEWKHDSVVMHELRKSNKPKTIGSWTSCPMTRPKGAAITPKQRVVILDDQYKLWVSQLGDNTWQELSF